MKFKVGDIVELIDNHMSMNAVEGAKAVVVNPYFIDKGVDYLEIEWIRDKKCKKQDNGAYFHKDFRVIGSTESKNFRKIELKGAKIKVTEKDVIIR